MAQTRNLELRRKEKILGSSKMEKKLAMLRWDTAVSCVCLASVTQHPQFTTLKQEGIKTGIRTDLSYPLPKTMKR